MPDPVKRRKTLRRILAVFAIIVAGLTLTIGLLFLEESWRARRDWERCRQELTSQGERLDASSFIPPPVPDAENLAMAPLFAPLNDCVKDPKSGAEVPRDPAAVEPEAGPAGPRRVSELSALVWFAAAGAAPWRRT